MRKLIAISSCIVVLLFSFFAWSYQKADPIDLINQQLLTDPTSSGDPGFKLFDATQFNDTMYPWLGFPVTILSEQQLLADPENISTPPDEVKIKKVLLKYQDKKRIILNITHWKSAIDKEDKKLSKLPLKWYLQVLKWTKEALPEADIGVLGIPSSPWSALTTTKSNMLKYQQLFEHIMPMIDASDSLYPLFHVFNEEKSDLYYLMGAQLYIAKTSGKPVYPVISHRKATKGSGLFEFVPIDLIHQQCSFIRKNADGMVWRSAESEDWDNRWYDAVADPCFL